MALPITLVANGVPATPARQGIPVVVVSNSGQAAAVLFVGDEFETDDGGTVTIDEITGGVITAATYTAPE